MANGTNLIVMLTHNDRTAKNAYEIFEQCPNSKAEFWGLKEDGIPLDEMKKLFSLMKENQKTTVLEVVAYSEKEGLAGAEMAKECNCDILMGTTFFDSINCFCKTHNIKYMPFVGQVQGRPSVLSGDINTIIAEAKEYLKKGVYGFDLLGYRYNGNALDLIARFVKETVAPVCVAGSINSFERLDAIKKVAPWAFTIGGAFFENKFEGTFNSQVNKVCDYIAKE